MQHLLSTAEAPPISNLWGHASLCYVRLLCGYESSTVLHAHLGSPSWQHSRNLLHVTLQPCARPADVAHPLALIAQGARRTSFPPPDKSLRRTGNCPTVACRAVTGRSRTETDWGVVAGLERARGRSTQKGWHSQLLLAQADPEQSGSASAAGTGWEESQACLTCLRTGCGQHQAAASCSVGCSSRAWQRAPAGTQWVEQTETGTSWKDPLAQWGCSGTDGSWTTAVERLGLEASGEHADHALTLRSRLNLSGMGSLEGHCRLRQGQGLYQSLAGAPAAKVPGFNCDC